MTVDTQRAQTLSSAAAVLSAFLVFVIGGGILLGVWAQKREVAQTAAEKAELAAEKERAAAKAKKERAAPKVEKASKSVRKRPVRSRPKPVEVAVVKEAPPAAETVKVAKSAKAATVKASTGRGSVLIYGDATRVRLVGSKGTFGAGKVPSGSYTVQATFSGFEPRMAGTVQVSDGARLNLVCASSTKTCEPR